MALVQNRKTIGGVAGDAKQINYKDTTVEKALDEIIKYVDLTIDSFKCNLQKGGWYYGNPVDLSKVPSVDLSKYECTNVIVTNWQTIPSVFYVSLDGYGKLVQFFCPTNGTFTNINIRLTLVRK